MKQPRIRNAQDVAGWRLCIGCGACAWACPNKNITLFNVIDDGIRPRIDDGGCKSCGSCIEVCPGIEIVRDSLPATGSYIDSLMADWGPVLEVWEGYATDPDIRYKGSSGGLATAISLYCLERENMQGVLHIGPDDAEPWKNKTRMSRSKEDLLRIPGARYAPARRCAGLGQIEKAHSPSVFVGKPCDVVAVRKSMRKSEALRDRLGLAIAIFCAGTPSSLGTLEMLKSLGVSPEDVAGLRYRGNGWPGMTTIHTRTAPDEPKQLTYKQSWGGILQKRRPFRCHLCPDHTGELADLSCADPWYREIPPNEPGRSLLLVRTEKGREIARRAWEQGYIFLESADPSIVYRSSTLYLAKRTVWGRTLAVRRMGIPYPRYKGLHLWTGWMKSSLLSKCRSIYGTFKRVLLRGMLQRKSLVWPSKIGPSAGSRPDS
jgi:coenzyme F420 hydrogenase subunit beta